MRKFLIALFILGTFFFYSKAMAAEINDFSVTIQVNADSTLNITEKIAYDLGAEAKHGIYRDIPARYLARGGNYNLRFSDISVTDGEGAPLTFSAQNYGSAKRIKIGDAATDVTGVKEYVIKYRIGRAINYFNDRDEIYWNATGNDWDVPIRQAKAAVILPQSVSEQAIKSNCYAGAAGVNASCLSDRFVYSGPGEINQIVFTHDRLNAKEGLTFVISLPPGIMQKPSRVSLIFETIRDNWILGLPIIALAVMFYLWHSRGRDPEGRGTIVTQYDAPDGLSPAEVGTILSEDAEPKEISAEIIHLAVRGYLKIGREESGSLIKKTDYVLTKLKNGDEKLNGFELKLLDVLFGTKTAVNLSNLKNKFYEDWNKIKKDIYAAVVKKGYFAESPRTTRIIYYVVGLAAMVGFGFFNLNVFGIISSVITGMVVIIFGHFMPARTKQGVDAKEYILGLKTYLAVAEKDRINFHNAPQKNPQIFERLLPFAMVLGVEKAWAKQFEGIYTKPPGWYSDPTGANFSALFLVGSLNNFSAKANSALTAAAPAASGGSGFGGGGFSGGGFGGGGGGSW